MKIEEWVDTFANAASLSDRHRDMLVIAFKASAQAVEDKFSDGLHCAFCGRPRSEVRYLVQGSYGACICDECAADALRMVTGHITSLAGL